jgi:hypothetical protein
MTTPAPALQWFCALNDYGGSFPIYCELLKVAVLSAQRHTRLVPHLLYDGADNALTAWLRDRGVTIIPRRSVFHEPLARIAAEQQRPQALRIGAGAFLRTELPRLWAEGQLKEPFVLYTDVDVMFMGEVCDVLAKLRPQQFAVAPEGLDRSIPDNMNSGVMLMNLPNLATLDAEFRAFVLANIDEMSRAYDQRAYKRFFGRERNGGRLLWDPLPAEFNWKPYWGESAAARIVHFHGAKPAHRAELARGRANPTVTQLARGGFAAYCSIWDEYLAAAGSPRTS